MMVLFPPPETIHEDESILVINKPSGMIVNRAVSVKEQTVQDWVEAETSFMNAFTGSSRPEYSEFLSRSGIVHRLDKETTGILIIAKQPEIFRRMQQMFKERCVSKTYLALVHGHVDPKIGEINVPIGRLPWNRERFGVIADGKPAVSEYRVLAEGSLHGDPVTAVEVCPRTGRTHQIRVHMKYLNHPLVGDHQYAGRKTSRRDRETVHRVMLHAWKISFTHPVTGFLIELTAPIPADMMEVLRSSIELDI
jgi:23S rRNA pseudouridine1911/1915/1917 synthase